MLKAANRGVRIRVLLDDMDLAGRDFSAAVLNKHENIEIRIFNPFSRNTFRSTQFVTRFGGVTRRMHNKSFTADNQASIIGGRNIGDEYFDASKEYTFSDLDVLLIGPAAQEVSTAFDLYWNNAIVYPLATLVNKNIEDTDAQALRQNFKEQVEKLADSEYLNALYSSDLANTLREGSMNYYWGDIDVIYDHPDKVVRSRNKTEYHLSNDLVKYFEGLSEELLLISPYFVPGKEGVEYLNGLVEKGVKVTVITNSLEANDVAAVHAGYKKYRKPLLEGGVDLYEFKSHTLTQKGEKQKYGDLISGLHTKSFVIDAEYVFIGSMNLDPRSAYENTELGAVIHNKALAALYKKDAREKLEQTTYRLSLEDGKLVWTSRENGELKIFTKEPNTSWWQRFTVNLMGLIPAESQL